MKKIIDNRFEELKQYVMDLTQVFPSARYVGWDIAITDEGPVLEEIAPTTTVEEVVAKTGAKLIIPETVKTMSF